MKCRNVVDQTLNAGNRTELPMLIELSRTKTSRIATASTAIFHKLNETEMINLVGA